MDASVHTGRNLNRSLSAPDVSRTKIVCRRIVLEEYFYGGKPARQISYECLDASAFNNSRQSFAPLNCTTTTTLENFHLINPRRIDYNNKIMIESMDIDSDDNKSSNNLLLQSPQAKLEMNDCTIKYRGQIPIITKNAIDLSQKIPKKRKFKSTLYFLSFVIILTAFLVPVYDSYFFNRNINVTKLEINLHLNLFNQIQQINQIVKVIDDLNYRKNPKILLLIGTTGVGKTYTINFIKDAFKPSQIYEININSIHDIKINIHRKVPYLLIIDNLTLKNTDETLNFLKKVPENKSILIILSFNIQETKDHEKYTIYYEQYDEIPKKYTGHKYSIETIKFNSLNKSLAKQYFNKANLPWTKLIDEHDFDTFGFKGVYSKLNLS